MSMVIGTGVIANRFFDYSMQSNYLIFAGSVNDSGIQNVSVFEAEQIALKETLSAYPEATFIYFSTCSILDPEMADTPYVLFKQCMEKLVQDTASKFLIFRLSQVMGLSDAKSSLVNYLVNCISNNRSFEIWQHAQKNIIDIDDVHEIVGEILEKNIFSNQTINVASRNKISVVEIVRYIEDFIGVSANYVLADKGTNYEIDISKIEPILINLNLNFDEKYIRISLEKYFGHLKNSSKLISMIVPTYNEEYGIDEFYRRLKNVLVNLSPRFDHEIIFVNDCSTDGTLHKLKLLAQADAAVKVINFSRNFGNQIGITAGIDFSQGDISIVIDDDLQDPPEIILNLIAKWDKGYKVVYGVRPKRHGVNTLFKLTAKLYYRFIGSLSDTKIPNDTGDFRLIDKAVVDVLKKIKEENRYYRGLVAWVGFSQTGVIYQRDRRYAGVSTFSFKKYANFALNGLTSFTEKPLFFSSLAGLFITTISFILALFLVISKIINPSVSIHGWTSLTVIILFFGGIQLFSIGILGIYISKIYREVKCRPLYIVEDTKNIEQFNHAK